MGKARGHSETGGRYDIATLAANGFVAGESAIREQQRPLLSFAQQQADKKVSPRRTALFISVLPGFMAYYQ